MTPEQFKNEMQKILETNQLPREERKGTDLDAEDDHITADTLMCDMLTELGYGEGIKIFNQLDIWYS